MDGIVEDGSLDDNTHDDTGPSDAVGQCKDVSKGFTFLEINSTRASSSKVICCHFSSDGKLLATGGHDKKAVLWHTDTLKPKTTLEEHSSLITDVRFSPNMLRLATSSFDKTVRVWDVGSPGYSIRIFTGHSYPVMSLDFHPTKDGLICSCDGDGEIRYWSISNGSCARVFKGGTAQVKFQPVLEGTLQQQPKMLYLYWMWRPKLVYNHYRDMPDQSIHCAGILLVSSWHLSARTLSEFGRLDQETKGTVFTS